MKRLYAMMLSVVTIVAFSLSVFAATSPSAVAKESVDSVQVSVADVGVKAVSKEMVQQAADLSANTTFLADLKVPAKAALAAVVEVTYSGTIPEGGVQIPFKVKNAKAGDVAYILHRQSVEPYTWEVVGQAVLGSDLTVVGTFHNFSPVMIMVTAAEDAVAAEGVKAPKTGDF